MGATSVGHLLRYIDNGVRARATDPPPELPDALARAAARIAAAARCGGRVLVCGTPDTASDVDHVVVEFVHPVITGARSVAALACHETEPEAIGRWIHDITQPADVVIVLAQSSADPVIATAATAAPRIGASVVTLVNEGAADVVVGCIEELAAKELRVVAYHVLWELVQLSLSGSDARGAMS